MRRSALLAALLLAGCATAPEGPKVVYVPTAVACVPVEFPPELDYPDTDAALREAPNVFERVRLLLAGRLMRKQRLREYEAAVSACRGAT